MGGAELFRSASAQDQAEAAGLVVRLVGIRQMDAVFRRAEVARVSSDALRHETPRACRGVSVMQSLGTVECRDGKLGGD